MAPGKSRVRPKHGLATVRDSEGHGCRPSDTVGAQEMTAHAVGDSCAGGGARTLRHPHAPQDVVQTIWRMSALNPWVPYVCGRTRHHRHHRWQDDLFPAQHSRLQRTEPSASKLPATRSTSFRRASTPSPHCSALASGGPITAVPRSDICASPTLNVARTRRPVMARLPIHFATRVCGTHGALARF